MPRDTLGFINPSIASRPQKVHVPNQENTTGEVSGALEKTTVKCGKEVADSSDLRVPQVRTPATIKVRVNDQTHQGALFEKRNCMNVRRDNDVVRHHVARSKFGANKDDTFLAAINIFTRVRNEHFEAMAIS